jgi:hypothetical protein
MAAPRGHFVFVLMCVHHLKYIALRALEIIYISVVAAVIFIDILLLMFCRAKEIASRGNLKVNELLRK